MKNITPNISIIIPVHNQWSFTKSCLQALYKTLPPHHAEIIIVDNASSDETSLALKNFPPHESIALLSLRMNKNEGFARACNIGARASSSNILIFLNNDTVPLPRWIDPIMEEFSDHLETGVTGSRLLYPQGRIQHAGVSFSDQGLPYHIYRGMEDNFPPTLMRREVSAVTGACLGIRKGIFKAQGGFNEKYKLGNYEDIDLCLKIKRKGRKVIYLGSSVLLHHENATKAIVKVPSRENLKKFLQSQGDSPQGTHRDEYHRDGFRLISVSAFFEIIQKKCQPNHSLFIYGAGSHTRQLFKVLEKTPLKTPLHFDGILSQKKEAPLTFLDQSIPVFPPEILREKKDAKIIFSSPTYEIEMERFLLEEKLAKSEQLFPLYRPAQGLQEVPNAWDEIYLPLLTEK